jgi:thymidylate kinase
MKSTLSFWNFLLNGKKENQEGDWFSKGCTAEQSITLRIISNRDGSPRWVYPTSLKKPYFLKFYPIVSWRSAIIYNVFKWLFHLKLVGLVSKKTTVYYNNKPHFLSWLPSNCDQYALFAGTVGPNQKILTYTIDEKGTSLFTKVAYGKSSRRLINNEISALNFIAEQNIQTFDYPTIIEEKENRLGIKELDIGKSVNKLTTHHLDSIQELYNLRTYNFTNGNGNLDTLILGILNIKPKNDVMKGLKSSLLQHHKNIKKTNTLFKRGFGHGDFTPWNCGLRGDHMVILDWEMADEYPLLFDVFHFIIQDKIMNTQIDAENIMIKVSLEMVSPKMLDFCSNNKIIWEDQLKAYLLTIASYYYKIYHEQTNIHPQAFRAMQIWNSLLDIYLIELGNISMKKIFTRIFFARLKKVNYSLMKNNNQLLIDHPDSSDFDLFISRKESKKTMKWIKSQPEVAKVYIDSNSYMQVASIYFNDGSFLSIDLISDLKRCALQYLDINKVIKSSTLTVDGLKIPSIECDMEYIILFYLLNHAPIPQKYYSYIERMSKSEEQVVLDNLKTKLRLTAISFSDFFSSTNTKLKKEITNYVNNREVNNGLSRIKNNLVYVIDTVRNRIKTKGVVVSFSGVDGAGKSTIIAHIKQTLENRYRKNVVVLRHRPSVLPILSSFIYGKKEAEQKAADTLPRQGGNSSVISSFFRFSYYLIDFVFGQFVVWFKYTLKGDVILYDRYYFDFIEDAKRSNITLPKGFRKAFYRLVNKPSVNIFLHAKPELILKRKQEMSYEDIQLLTSSYKNLFEEFDNKYSGKYISIENEEMQVTLNKIESLITAAA